MDNGHPFSIGNIDQFILQRSARLHIPADTYKHILTTSLAPSLQDLNDLRQAVERQDYDAMQNISHRLKGVYANLRIDELALLAKTINQKARDAGPMQDLTKHFEDFKKSFTILKDAVQP